MAENIIENDENFEAFIRAFWRRIEPFKNDYGKELPDELPTEFRAHMATAALALKLDGVTEKEAERWATRLNWLHTEYGADCNGCDSGDLLDCVETEMRQVINTLEGRIARLGREYSSKMHSNIEDVQNENMNLQDNVDDLRREIQKLAQQRDDLLKKLNYYQEFTKIHGSNVITDLVVQRDNARKENAELRAQLARCADLYDDNSMREAIRWTIGWKDLTNLQAQ